MARRRWSFFMSPLEHGFIRRLDDGYRNWLTPSGRMVLWATMAAALLLLGGVVLPLVAVFSFGAALLLSAALLGAAFRPRLHLRRRLPGPLSAGEVLTYQVVVENRGRRAARLVSVHERRLPAELRPLGESPVIHQLLPGESREVTLRLSCQQRGAYTLDRLSAASAFPSGLVKWGRRAPPGDRLLVYPRVQRLASFEVPHGRNYQPGGIAVASQVGDSVEFFGTREWREGDRVRDIHWPSSARTGQLVVKEFQQEYFVRLALVLDVAARTARQEDLFERSLSLAAGIADSLARRDYIIDLFAAGRSVVRFQAGRALARVEHLLELLACLEPDTRFDAQVLEDTLLAEAARLSAVVLVTLDWDERREHLARALKSRGVELRVLCLRPLAAPASLGAEEWVRAP